MNVLGLDLATNTGYGIVEDGKCIEHGNVNFEIKRGQDNGIKFMKYRKWLLEKLMETSVDLIAYEQGHMRGGPATEVLLGFQTHTQSAASEHQIQLYPVHSGTLKKWAVNHGKASKDSMIAKAEELTGDKIESDDEADAVLLALKGYEDLMPSTPST